MTLVDTIENNECVARDIVVTLVYNFDKFPNYIRNKLSVKFADNKYAAADFRTNILDNINEQKEFIKRVVEQTEEKIKQSGTRLANTIDSYLNE